MNIVFTILLILASIIAVVLVIALFTKKEYTIERGVTIGRARPDVFRYVRFLRNQEQYSKWVMLDPAMKKEFRGTDGAVGFVYAWDSNNQQAGKGEQEIRRIDDDKQIDVQIRFERPFRGISETRMTTDVGSRPEQTNVKWTFQSRMNYPMNIMLLVLNFDKLLGADMESSLTLLKTNLEQKEL